MNKKIISIICMLVIVLTFNFVKAESISNAKDLNEIKSIIESKSNGNINASDLLKAYNNLTEKYSNDEIANAIEENEDLLKEKGISQTAIDSSTKILKSVDSKQLKKVLSENIDVDKVQKQLESGASPSEILNDIQQDMSTTEKLTLGLNLITAFWAVKVVIIVFIIFVIYNIIIRWRIYNKAGKNGWAAIIPIYRDVVMYKICDVSPWVLLLVLIPVLGWFILGIINIYIKFTLAEGFGKGIGFGFGLWLLGPIFEAILAFSKNSKYIGFKTGYSENS